MSKCSDVDCQLAWLNPVPVESEIAKAYHGYYTHTPPQPGLLGSGQSIFKAIQASYAKLLGCAGERSSMEAYFLDKEPPATVLEIGSGNGVRLKRMVAMGWDVQGQEIDAAAAMVGRSIGLQIYSGSIHDTYFTGKKYDRIVSNHVIEHLHDPAGMMIRCRELLNESGKVIIITPNICGFGSRLFGRNWRGLEPPRHIQIYSPASLRQLLLNCGYSEVEVFSSAARADLIITGSIDLAFYGSHTPSHAGPKLVNAVISTLLWTLARLSFFVNENSGEELVAIAHK